MSLSPRRRSLPQPTSPEEPPQSTSTCFSISATFSFNLKDARALKASRSLHMASACFFVVSSSAANFQYGAPPLCAWTLPSSAFSLTRS